MQVRNRIIEKKILLGTTVVKCFKADEFYEGGLACGRALEQELIGMLPLIWPSRILKSVHQVWFALSVCTQSLSKIWQLQGDRDLAVSRD